MMGWLRGVTARYLDYRFSPLPGIQARIVERPGRWLSAGAQARLVDDLRYVVRNTLPEEALDYGVLTGDAERLENCILTVLYDASSGKAVAFNALALMGVTVAGRREDVLHLGLVMVDPRHRERGMSWVLYGLTGVILFMRNQMRPFWVSNVTQVPAIVGMVAESFSDVFPVPGGGHRSFTHLVIAREISRRHRHVFGVGAAAEFDEADFIFRNAYTGGSDNLKKTFEQAPKHRTESYNDFCRHRLDYGRGDDFLQLGRMTLGSIQHYLLRSVPRRSLLSIGYRLAFVFLGAVLLPVVHWLHAGRESGELRPWREA